MRRRALVALALLGCSGAEALPEGTAITVDGEPILAAEIELVALPLRAWEPGTGLDTSRAAALEAGLLPRALFRREFSEGVGRAREKARVALSLLREGKTFDEVRRLLSEAAIPEAPATYRRSLLDPILSAAIFGRTAGFVTPEPVETSYAVILARVDLPIPDDGPQQSAAILSTIELYYDPSLADFDYRIELGRDRMRKARYEERLPGAFQWLPAWIRTTLPDPPR